MKKKLLSKPLALLSAFCFLLSAFLPCSAQSYTVYNCDFENWTDGKPNGWQTSVNAITSQYTPALTGFYACKVEAQNNALLGLHTTESIAIYGDKKYTLSFSAKLLKGSMIIVSIANPNTYWAKYFTKQIVIDSEWKDYEIEFITSTPYATTNCRLQISISNQGGVEFVIDRIKLVAQDRTMEFDYLDANNLKTYINPIVPFFNSNYPEEFFANYFEAPKNSKKTTFFSMNLFMGGWSQPNMEGNLHLAVHKSCQYGRDYWLGPITTDFVEKYDENNVLQYAGISDAYRKKYHHTWKVTKAEIEYHKKHYANPDYVIPWGIANWPAHGRTEFGESAYLAPYKNVAGNSSYEPALGDYPEIRGDEAVFFILNDKEAAHTESKCPNPLEVEILGMAYSCNSYSEAVQNTLFFSYTLRNKSTITYHDFYFGLFADFDIGFPNDDYIGCDTLRNLAYGYNGREIDGMGRPWEYGENPPAQGVMFLNQKLSSFLYHLNSLPGDPQKYQEYYNVLTARWMNGRHLTYGGTGFSFEPDAQLTNYAFSGDPVAGTGWTEFMPDGPGSIPNVPSDRRGTLSTGPFTFTQGGSITIDVALPFAQANGLGPLGSLSLLREFADEIQLFYDDRIIGIKENTASNHKLLLYPNPSNGEFTIKSDQIIESFEVYDRVGKKVFADTPKTATAQIATRLHRGLYIYRAVLGNHSVCSGKIVIQ